MSNTIKHTINIPLKNTIKIQENIPYKYHKHTITYAIKKITIPYKYHKKIP
jgi:hypothetical protein